QNVARNVIDENEEQREAAKEVEPQVALDRHRPHARGAARPNRPLGYARYHQFRPATEPTCCRPHPYLPFQLRLTLSAKVRAAQARNRMAGPKVRKPSAPGAPATAPAGDNRP